MFKEKLNYKLLNVLILCGIIYLIMITSNYWGGVLYKLLSILSPFILSFGISYAIYPLVRKLRKKGLSNKLAVTIVSACFILLILLVIGITIPLLYDQLVTLSQSVSEVFTEFSSKFEVNLGDFKATIQSVLNTLIEGVGNYVTNGIGSILNSSISFVSNSIIVLILSIYFLGDMEKIRREVRKLLLRNEKNHRFYEFVRSVDKELGQYLGGLATFIVVQLVEYSLLFGIIGHPNWFLLGVLAAITTVIPYFGGLFTNIIAVILASVRSFPLFIATLVVCLIFPNVDGYVISPKIYGKTNNINPIWTITAVIVGGALFGVIGIAIAVPLYIILRCTFNFYKDDILDKIENIKDVN